MGACGQRQKLIVDLARISQHDHVRDGRSRAAQLRLLQPGVESALAQIEAEAHLGGVQGNGRELAWRADGNVPGLRGERDPHRSEDRLRC